MNPVGRWGSPTDRQLATLLGVAAFCALVLTTGGHLSSVDELTTFRTAESLLQGDRAIDPDVAKAERGLLLVNEHRDGELVGTYGIGPSAVGAVGYRAASVLADALDADARERDLLVRFGFVVGNVAVSALGVPAAYVLARALGASTRRAAVAAALATFGTYLWVLGRTAWPDVPAAALGTAALAAAVRSVHAPSPPAVARWAVAAGALAGTALHFRVSAVLVLLCTASYFAAVAGERARRVVAFGSGLLPGLIGLLAVQWWRFGSPFETGYAPVAFSTPLGRGVAANLWSPGRGILLFAPVVVLGLGAGWAARRTRLADHVLLVGHAVVVTVVVSRYADWDGGHTYGPRYLAAAVLPLAAAAGAGPASRAWGHLVGGVGGAGVVMHGLLGVAVYFGSVYAVALPAVVAEEARDPSDLGDAELAAPVRFRLMDEWDRSPLVEATRLLPTTLDLTVLAAGGGADDLAPWPDDPRSQPGYWDEPSMVDIWWARWSSAGGDPWVVLLVAPVIAIGGSVATALLWIGLRPRPAPS